jgi:predicted O-methyltransferase YrrM
MSEKIARLLNAAASLKMVNSLFLELLLDADDKYVYEYAYNLFFLVTVLEPREILDLGTGGKGVSLRAMLAGLLFNNKGGSIITIDVNSHGELGMQMRARVHNVVPEGMVQFFTGDDLSLDVGRKVDLVFLDTSHEYKHTLDELYKFSVWTDLIVCHDTKLEGVRRAIDVFLDTRGDWKKAEIGETPYGLGILYKLVP